MADSTSVAASAPETFFLTGDIGGTNLRLELRNRNNELVKKFLVKTSDYKNFTELLTAFFKEAQVAPSQVAAAVSFASKILQNRAVTNANYKWELADGNLTRDAFGFKNMMLLNDFEACGYAVPLLDQSRIVCLKGTGQPDLSQDYKILLVGPGTGLGVCLLSQR